MAARLPAPFTYWPEDAPEEMSPKQVQEMYERGFAGCWRDEESREKLEHQIRSIGISPDGSDVAHEFGLAETGKDQLVIPFVYVVDAYPGCWPGPAQGRGDCVSHDEKNCILGSMVGDVITAMPDEVTGFIESLPEISSECILQGALGTEPIYWYRRHGGDGWSCDEAALVTQNESGVWIRKDYPELGFDLSKYSASLAGKYGRTLPPTEIAAEGKKHLVRTTTFMKSFEECRDFLKNFYFLSSCGGEGYSSKRDENGVSRRSGAWAHAMFGAGADDRPETKQIYGEGLILDGNSWGPDWNSGPRDIRDSAKYVPAEKKQRWIEIDLVNPSTGNIMIPKGFFWVRWSEWKRRQIIAKSSVNGFPRRKPNHLFI